MKKRALAVAACLGLAGCSYQAVNEYSVFKYRASDEWFEPALKTFGNIPPWTGEAVVLATAGALVLGFLAGIAYLQSGGSR